MIFLIYVVVPVILHQFHTVTESMQLYLLLLQRPSQMFDNNYSVTLDWVGLIKGHIKKKKVTIKGVA